MSDTTYEPVGLIASVQRRGLLAAATLMVGAFVVTNKASVTEHTFRDDYWLVVPLLLCVLQFVSEWRHDRRFNADQRHRTINVLGADQLTGAITGSLHGFEGTFDVCNAEMNTLDNVAFWTTLCKCPGITRIRIAVSPRVFQRFETALASNDLRAAFQHARDKVRVLPVHFPSARTGYAYAMLDGSGKLPDRTKIFVFPKLDPFSLAVESGPRPRDVRFNEWRLWAYRLILVGSPTPLVEEARNWFTHNWSDEAAYSISEMQEFVEGTPLSASRVAELHFLSASDSVLRLFQDTQRSLVEASAPSRGPEAARALRRLRGEFGEGEVLIPQSINGTARPALLWLPPWGFPDWPQRMATFDQSLAQDVAVIHLRTYAMGTHAFSISGAVRDATAVINDIVEHPELYGVDKDRLILAGVSISAFVAAEVAAAFESRVLGLCMFAPVLDVFDALDAFRAREGIALFTRGVYFGKQRFRVSDLRAQGRDLLRFFDTQAGESMVLDLPLRGSERCRLRFCQANIAAFTRNRRNRVLLASSKHDQMTRWGDIEAVKAQAEPGQLDVTEIDWVHDIDGTLTGRRRFTCRPPTSPAAPGWEHVMAFVRQCVGASPREARASSRHS